MNPLIPIEYIPLIFYSDDLSLNEPELLRSKKGCPMAELYIYPYSPYSQRVMFAMEEMNIPYSPVVTNLGAGDHMKSPFKDMNPFRRVPVYRSSHITISESRAIIRHLATDPKMAEFWPTTPAERARVDQWMEYLGAHLGNHISSLAWEKVYSSQYGSAPDKHMINLLEKKLDRELPVLEEQLSTHKWICGHHLTLAEFILQPHIANMPLSGIDPAKWPSIQRWHQQCSSLNSWKKVMATIEDLVK